MEVPEFMFKESSLFPHLTHVIGCRINPDEDGGTGFKLKYPIHEIEAGHQYYLQLISMFQDSGDVDCAYQVTCITTLKNSQGEYIHYDYFIQFHGGRAEIPLRIPQPCKAVLFFGPDSGHRTTLEVR